jgi:large subunit ribosomal protein L21e
MRRIGGLRRKTRSLYTIPTRQKGKISITKYMQQFNDGDKVKLKFNSSVDISPFKQRYHGKVGSITGKRGACYKVVVKARNGEKIILAHPIHLMRL